MSHIFDALQRSEAEQSRISPSAFTAATDLLQIAEGHAGRPSDVGSPRISNQLQATSISALPGGILVSVTQKQSLAAEKFRFLAVRLRQLQQAKTLKKVLITSTIPEEGKSMVAGNLACTMARKLQQRTLLLEGDLRKPTQCRQFGLGNVSGLSEWLRGEESSRIPIYHLESLGLWVLPAGNVHENALELLQSGRLLQLMEQLNDWFDWIVIDSPPILPLADTSIWVRAADGVLLVTRPGTTEKQQLQRGLEAIEKAKLLGALINNSASAAHSSYHRYYHMSPGTPTQDQLVGAVRSK
jgi:capsular exopolysaccharide synthesis family protein